MNQEGIDSRMGRGEFGRRIRELRHHLGYSQEALAERAGIHRTYVSNLEGGKRNVSLDNILCLARALDVAPSELFVQPAEA